MFSGLSKFFPGSNHRFLNKLQPLVDKVNDFEKHYQAFSDDKLSETTELFKKRIKAGESLDDILPEVFAVVREAAKRVLGQRHFDVQLMGGIVLNQGRISEMKTGEGKTLVATLAAYLNSLESKGVHVITVNDYLSKRDAQWMGSIYGFLGISTAALQNKTAYIYDFSLESNVDKLREISRKEAYEADITYGTNSEFGFDYLRDNMVSNLDDRVQRVLNYAIVDEVDNILIDEARTPLIISGPAQESTNEYKRFARIVSNLSPESDYSIDQKHRTVSLTQGGISQLEEILNISNLYDYSNLKLVHFAENALKANALYKKDVEYVIKDGSIVIVDEFTGRLMFGRRYSDGIHQALEAKENLSIQRETMTFAVITIQNYFRMYPKLSGMTGTAVTESEEFHKIYKLDVVEIPTNQPMIRDDRNDLIYRDQKSKYNAVVSEILSLYGKGTPILVGTIDIAKSEMISEMLKTKNIPHQVLNAKQHEKEAEIVAQAGKTFAVTIATNMAGRGTDIVLGGNPDSLNLSQEEWISNHKKIIETGGLHIIGTERHEARRIDNQLRGRAGRQGDPGNSRFFVSLDDDLMRRFGGDTIRKFMDMAGMDKDVPIENQMITRQIESAQVKVEGYHFDIRKNLVEYDDVANAHRSIIYSERQKILTTQNLTVHIFSIVEREIFNIVGNYTSGLSKLEWDFSGLFNEISSILRNSDSVKITDLQGLESDEMQILILKTYKDLYEDTENFVGFDQMREFEKQLLLHIIDEHWVYHLTAMENLRQGIGLQAVGQRDPLVAYKKEAHDQFQDLLARIENDVVRGIFTIRDSIKFSSNSRGNSTVQDRKKSIMSEIVEKPSSPRWNMNKKVGRNEKCPCGSGKKYKKCHVTEL